MNDNVIKEFIDSIKAKEINKDVIYSATISHVDNEGVVWVFLPGANKATPTESSSADVRSGDVVNVQWQNNKLYILGNYSNPSAGMMQMRQVEQSANIARESANSAVADASRAREAAGQAETNADNAKTAADNAKTAADSAMKGLGQVEDVVGTLNWITDHSKVATDTTPQAGKSYYIKNQDNTFTLVTDVEGKNPAQEGWYELTEAVQNYILSHLALTNEGLYVMKDNSHWKLLIKNDGVYVVDENNIPVNQMGIVGNVVGYETNVHIATDQDSIEFYDGGDILGYIGNSKLLFASAEVTNNLSVTDKYVWRKTPQGAMGLYLR